MERLLERREEQGERNVQWQVAMKRGQRKALPDDAYGDCLNLLEKAKASIRAKVEHPFHVIKNLFKHGKARYRGLGKNEVQLFSLFGLANLVLTRRQGMSTDTQGAS